MKLQQSGPSSLRNEINDLISQIEQSSVEIFAAQNISVEEQLEKLEEIFNSSAESFACILSKEVHEYASLLRKLWNSYTEIKNSSARRMQKKHQKAVEGLKAKIASLEQDLLASLEKEKQTHIPVETRDVGIEVDLRKEWLETAPKVLTKTDPYEIELLRRDILKQQDDLKSMKLQERMCSKVLIDFFNSCDAIEDESVEVETILSMLQEAYLILNEGQYLRSVRAKPKTQEQSNEEEEQGESERERERSGAFPSKRSVIPFGNAKKTAMQTAKNARPTLVSRLIDTRDLVNHIERACQTYQITTVKNSSSQVDMADIAEGGGGWEKEALNAVPSDIEESVKEREYIRRKLKYLQAETTIRKHSDAIIRIDNENHEEETKKVEETLLSINFDLNLGALQSAVDELGKFVGQRTESDSSLEELRKRINTVSDAIEIAKKEWESNSLKTRILLMEKVFDNEQKLKESVAWRKKYYKLLRLYDDLKENSAVAAPQIKISAENNNNNNVNNNNNNNNCNNHASAQQNIKKLSQVVKMRMILHALDGAAAGMAADSKSIGDDSANLSREEDQSNELKPPAFPREKKKNKTLLSPSEDSRKGKVKQKRNSYSITSGAAMLGQSPSTG